MKTRMFLKTVSLLVFFLEFLVSQASAQSNPTYYQLSPTVKAVLYKPDSGPKPHIGVISMHEDSNRLDDLACKEFSKRGFICLGVNGRSDNNEALDFWDDLPLDLGVGVKFLKEKIGVSKVILYAGSGGGPLMTFYQSIAEKGPSACQGPNKLTQCGNDLAGLPPADAIVFRDAHAGTAINTLRSLDPSIINEEKPDQVDPSLDPFNPKNGFNPTGPSTYSEEFKKRYFKAQADRMSRLLDKALEIRRRMKEGKYPYPDDDVFPIPRSDCARLMEFDLSIHHSTVKPRKLLKNDGTIVTQIVESVRVPSLRKAKENKTFICTKNLTIRSFLGTRAIRAKDSMDDIDICSNNNSTPCHLKNISVPLLFMAAGGHYFIRDNEINFEIAVSSDKDFIVIEGASHGFTPCVPCERFPGQYSNTVKNAFDYARDWINRRF